MSSVEAGLSTEAKSLIQEILVTNPSNRPTLDSIMRHPFMTKNSIPKQLPISSLAFPPSGEFISQYIAFDKSDNNSKMLSSTTTNASIKKAIAETANKGSILKQIEFNTVQSQKNIGVRAVTASKPEPPQATVGSTKAFIRTNNYVSSLQRQAFQPPPRTAIKPVLQSSKKSSSTALKMLGSTCSKQAQGSTPMIQCNSILSGNSTTSNLNIATVTSGFGRVIPTSATNTVRPSEAPMEYIMYYQDYSDKYGFGYVLTNGVIGFYYNDMTNLLWVEHRSQYAYSDFYSKGDKAGMMYFSEGGCNKDIEKKVKILAHFRSWCQRLKDEGKAGIPLTVLPSTIGIEVALKRIVKTKNGILLRFTNNVVQMIFLDQSQIVLCFKSKTLIYISRKGKKQSMKISNELLVTAGEKVVKRFKYTLNMLNYLNSNGGTGSKLLTVTSKTKIAHERKAPQLI